MNESDKQNVVGFWNKIKPCFEFINKASGLYLLWILVHFLAAHLYIYYCVPATFIGFITSPFMAATPHCYAFRWCISRGAETIASMWVVFGTFIASKFVIMVGTVTRS